MERDHCRFLLKSQTKCELNGSPLLEQSLFDLFPARRTTATAAMGFFSLALVIRAVETLSRIGMYTRAVWMAGEDWDFRGDGLRALTLDFTMVNGQFSFVFGFDDLFLLAGFAATARLIFSQGQLPRWIAWIVRTTFHA